MDQTDISPSKLLSQFRQCSHLQRRTCHMQGQGRILRLLLEHGTLTQKQLADITQRRSATLSDQLEMMESVGWITRVKNQADKRNIDVALTDAGLAKAKEAEQERTRTANSLFSVLSIQEQRQLSHILQKLYDSWQKNPLCRQEKEEP